MFKEFKEFAMRGNVVDMAVGIIIGGSLRYNHSIPCERRDYASNRPGTWKC